MWSKYLKIIFYSFLQENNLNGTNRYNLRRVGRRIAKKTIELSKTDLDNQGKWKTYGIDLSKMIQTDPGAIYRIELSFKKNYATYLCDGSERVNNSEDNGYFEEDYYEEESYATQASEDADEREEQYWDNQIYNYRNYRYYNWEDRQNPCKEAYYFNEDNIVSTNILASNLGVIAKRSEK